MDGKKLYKARGSRILFGVCGGVAEYFNVDPTLVRLAFAAAVILWGSGFLLYIIAAIVMPEPPYDPMQ
ncbi:PspC domain-containing protein [Ruthenibacterium sp. CLA-JM-H11]|uniref:PspC domain-containing protein n=1 Tax=Ruthenibacterium intestinale TaxID=3133163 RepID=A0ABV1GGP5_9FIRM